MNYIVGSKMLGLRNAHDTDCLVLIDSTDAIYKRGFENNMDMLYRSSADLKAYMNFEIPFASSSKAIIRYLANYQFDRDIIGQDFPLEFHILDKKEKYLELLNYILATKSANFDKDLNFNNGHCSKLIYHVAYLTFILENNSTELTAEQREIVQKIHDKKMPVEYLDVLEEKIRNLK